MKNLNSRKVINKIFPYLPARIRNVIYYRFLWNIDFPEIVHIENTNACNANCIICSREKLTRPIGVMDFGLFKKIIDECSKYKNLIREIHLHGFGEPLLDKLIFDKVKYAKGKGIKKTYFVTTASLLSSEVTKKIISSGLDRIKFSLYGVTKETYEKIHRGLKYEEVEGNIRNFFYIRKKMNSKKPTVIIQFVPQENNRNENAIFFNRWKEFIDARIGDRVEEFYLHNWVYGRDYNRINLATSNAKSCAIPFHIIQILWDGDVVPCVFDFDGKMPMGEVRTRNIKEIWNGLNYDLLRNYHRQKRFDKLSLCAMCDQLKRG
jgi:radical SAM protein with 4Fe4S-binding SPASM domain